MPSYDIPPCFLFLFCPKTRVMARSFLEKCAWSRNRHKLNICFLWSSPLKPLLEEYPLCKLICWNIMRGRTQKGCICCSHDLIISSKTYSQKCLKSFPTTPATQTYRREFDSSISEAEACIASQQLAIIRQTSVFYDIWWHFLACVRSRGQALQRAILWDSPVLHMISTERATLKGKLALFSVLFICDLPKWLQLDTE